MEVVASLSQGRTAAAQCGLFTHKSVPVIFEPPCILSSFLLPLPKRAEFVAVIGDRATELQKFGRHIVRSEEKFLRPDVGGMV